MIIQNPYSHVQHEVFKRTFLQEVSASVSFADTPLLSNKDSFKNFLKLNFGVTDDFPDILKLGGITVSSDNEMEKYYFSTNSASVTLNASIYSFYGESLVPRIRCLVDFLDIVGVKTVTDFTISKNNVFRATSSNAYSSWRFALHETFKDKTLRDLATITSVSDKPFKITIEGAVKFDGGDVRIPFLVEVIDESNFYFQMKLKGSVRNIAVEDILKNAEVLNDILYVTFCDAVSDKTIELMRQ